MVVLERSRHLDDPVVQETTADRGFIGGDAEVFCGNGLVQEIDIRHGFPSFGNGPVVGPRDLVT